MISENKEFDGNSISELSEIIKNYYCFLIPNWTATVKEFSQEINKVKSKSKADLAEAMKLSEADIAVIKNEANSAQSEANARSNPLSQSIADLLSNANDEMKEAESNSDLFGKDKVADLRTDNKYKVKDIKDLGVVRNDFTIFDAISFSTFQNHYGKIALGSFIVGWILTNFAFSIFVAAGSLALFLMFAVGKANGALTTQRRAIESCAKRVATARENVATINAECAETKKKILSKIPAIEKRLAKEIGELNSVEKARKDELRKSWGEHCQTLYDSFSSVKKEIKSLQKRSHGRLSPPSGKLVGVGATPDQQEQLTFRLGEETPTSPVNLDVELVGYAGIRRPPPEPSFKFPVTCSPLDRRALLLKTSGQPASSLKPNIFEGLMTRVLQQLPAGKATFTLFDPLGLGSNFGPFLKLQEYSEALVNGTVWTGADQISRRIEDLIKHIENVTQKYLRADFENIEEYNEHAKEIAEPYRFLVVCDFPEGFNEQSTRDLIRVLQNGPRCGVHTLLHWNSALKSPYGFDQNELLQFSNSLTSGGALERTLSTSSGFDDKPVNTKFVIDHGPAQEPLKKLVDSYGDKAVEAMKVEVGFEKLKKLAKMGDEWWTENSVNGVFAPLGPMGAKKAISLTLDSKLSHNALIVGRPGSGKSNLLHVFISMVTQKYSPDEIELYLIDFKKGVEFKDYAEAALPHARVIAVESEREFGLSVLQAIDREMTLRSELFKAADGAANIGVFRKRRPDHVMPRAVLIIDEFQELFTKEDKIKTESAQLIDRIIRQGRGFGVHTILGTQSLNNSGLPRSTIDQITVRIAMQCSEADSQQILANDNIAARSLTRPGEAILNDKAGLVEGNQHFQVALYKDEERKDELNKLTQVATRLGWDGEPPRIFEGHELAPLTDCKEIMRFDRKKITSTLKCWLGEPVSLEAPVFAEISSQGGRNLLVVSKEERQVNDLILASLTSLVSQLPAQDIEFSIVDLTTADSEWADFPEAFRDSINYGTYVCGKHGLKELLPQLEKTIDARRAELELHSDSQTITDKRKVLVILGAHRARDLRMSSEPRSFISYDESEGDRKPDLSELMKKIVSEGPDVGVHTMIWTDSIANFERIFDRGMLNEFGIRISGPLNERDSHTLFDTNVAAQITQPNRMIFYDDDKVGVFSLFRPYKIPSEEFFVNFAKNTLQYH